MQLHEQEVQDKEQAVVKAREDLQQAKDQIIAELNKKKDEMAANGVVEANVDDVSRAFEDLTDKENLSFRYVY